MSETKQRKKIIRNIIKIDRDLCTGCGKCVIGCAEGALEIIDGKAEVVNESYCDGLGACIGECPEGALTIERREAYEFDEDLVEEHMNSIEKKKNTGQESVHVCSCPSSKTVVFNTPWVDTAKTDKIPSALRQWPIKLSLINPNTPYFNKEELVIVSDCSPVAFGDFHRKIMRGRPLITLCPMLGIGEAELDKLERILKENPIKKIELVLMEVPCCRKLNLFLDTILAKIERPISVKETIISREGTIEA
ncbi:MAG: 4Fe-4S ferredoxin [Promethearchaeota archaeon]|nr:MAG: 4Fe-4S ferredoxin [Candidatus Lokiarchaeota archaeon]